MKFSIAILAGGTSKRMGQDKALLSFGEVTFLSRMATLAVEFSADVMICSNNPKHKIEGTRLISDFKSNIGPLGGLIPAIESSLNELTLILPCDMPFLNSEFIEYLSKKITTQQIKPIIPLFHSQPQYLCGVYPKEILVNWKFQITSNNLSVKHNLTKANCNFVEMDFLGTNTFRNINTFEEYQSLLK